MAEVESASGVGRPGGIVAWPRDGQLFAPLLMPAALAWRDARWCESGSRWLGDGFVVAVRRRRASSAPAPPIWHRSAALFARPDRPSAAAAVHALRKAMSSQERSANASASARPTRAIIHVTPPDRGRWAGARGPLWAPLARPSRGAGATAEPVGRDVRLDRVADGADFRGSTFDRRRDGSSPARSASVPGNRRSRSPAGGGHFGTA